DTPEDSEIRGDHFVREHGRMLENELARRGFNSRRAEGRRSGAADVAGPEPGSPEENVLIYQQCVLVTVRELCADAARGYWQAKRPRPRLALDIPSSRELRRRMPSPERQQRD